MKNIKLKKAIYTTMLASLLLTGCGKKAENPQPTTEVVTEAYTEEVAGPSEAEEVISNQTIAQIVEEYKKNVDPNVDDSDFKIDEYKTPKYVWKYIDANGETKYVYNYNITGYDAGYEYIDCEYSGEMCVVKVNTHQNGGDYYMPISGLFKQGDKVVNIKVTTRDDMGNDHKPLENYIIVDNPTVEKYKEMKSGMEYILSEAKEPAIVKEENEYTLLYKNN